MSIKQYNSGNHIITYDNETHSVLSMEPTDDYKKRKENAIAEILAKKDDFKQRGVNVVKDKFVDDWKILVNRALEDQNQVWYNGAIIEASLQCMERLSQGLPVEEAYIPIDVQNPDVPCVHLDMELSGWQNYSVTNVVSVYHERGTEFCNYRNSFVKNQEKTKQKTKNLY